MRCHLQVCFDHFTLSLPDHIRARLFLTAIKVLNLWTKSYGVTIQMKPLQQYFPWYYCIYLVCSSNFWVWRWNPMVLPFKWNLFSNTFSWSYSLSNTSQIINFKNILQCSRECTWNGSKPFSLVALEQEFPLLEVYQQTNHLHLLPHHHHQTSQPF